MAIEHGKEGTIKLATNAVASVISWTAAITLATSDGSSMGDDWDNPIAGRGTWSGTLNFHLNLEDIYQKQIHDALVTASPTGALSTLRLYKDAATHYYSGSVLITGVNPSVSKDDVNKLSVNFVGVGAPVYN